MYVTLKRETNGATQTKKIAFIGNDVSIKQVLEAFGIKKLLPSEKIWIKREGQKAFRKKNYILNTATLNRVYHRNCTIVLTKKCPPPDFLTYNYQVSPTPEQKPPEKVKVQKGKRVRHRPPRAVKRRNDILRHLRVKKIKRRIATEEAAKQAALKNKDQELDS